MKNVFISRNLSWDSPFLRLLTEAGYVVEGRSLIEFSMLPIHNIPATDWVFFYSKKGVEFFLRQVKKLPKEWKIAAYGSGTATYLESRGISPDFVGDGSGQTTTPEFLKIAKGKRVIFPQAKESRRTVEVLAGSAIRSVSLVVYQSQPAEDIHCSEADWLVFTSPKNVAAYQQHCGFKNHQLIVVIGETTARAVDRKGVFVAEEASEEGLVRVVLGQ